MFGYSPWGTAIGSGALNCTANESNCVSEILAVSSLRASHAVQPEHFIEKLKVKRFAVGILLLPAQETAFEPSVKWPVFQSKFSGRFKVQQEMHPRHILSSKPEKLTRRAAHTRSLVWYHTFESTTSVLTNFVNMITKVRVPRLLPDYICRNFGGRRINDCFATITTESKEQEVLV